MVTNWSKVPPFSDHSIPWGDWLSWKKAVQSIMPSRSLTGLWWRPTFQQNICVLGDLRDPLSFCDLPILFLTALSFISSMQVLYCVALSLEAIHCVDIDLFFFSYLFVRHQRQIVFLVHFALQRSHENVCFCCCTSTEMTCLQLESCFCWFFRKAKLCRVLSIQLCSTMQK